MPSDYDYLFKVVLIGAAGVGKSCLLARYVDDTYNPESLSTIGVDFKTKTVDVNGKRAKLQLWDTAGQERFRSISQAYYRGAHGILVVFDVTNYASFVEAKELVKNVPSLADDAIILLLGNKIDLGSREVFPNEIDEFASNYDIGYVEVSAKTGSRVHEAITGIISGNMPTNALQAPKRRYITGGTTNLPLTNIDVHCELRDLIATVKICQRFENKTSNPLELTVGFPIDELGSVCKFEAIKQDGDRIVGKVLSSKKAAAKYDDAVAEGKVAVMLEEKARGVFLASVGNLAPGKYITVEITYVTELQIIRGDVYLFTFKTAFEKQDKLLYYNSSVQNQSVLPNYSLKVDIFTNSPITYFRSSSHNMGANMLEGGKHAKIEVLSSPRALVDCSFELRYTVSDIHIPTASLEYNSLTATHALMVPYIPDWKTDINPSETEFVFVVDRSGSMSGEPWQACSTALQIFLRSIPIGCSFQVVGFGSNYESVFPKGSCKYDNTSLTTASQYIRNWDADLGGTELLLPLKHVYSSPTPSNIKYRRVIVLTDGQVGNRSQVVDLVSKYSDKFETSALGIGTGVDRSLITEMADAGKGSHEFAVEIKSLEAKIIKQLKTAMGLRLSAKINWGDLPVTVVANEQSVEVYKGEKTVFYALFDEKQPGQNQKFTVTINGAAKTQTISSTVTVDTSVFSTGTSIHALAARNYIRQIMTDTSKQSSIPRIIDLSTKYSISSQYASFVAVEEKASGEATENTMQKVDMTLTETRHVKSGGLLGRQYSSAAAPHALMMASAPIMMDRQQAYHSGGCCDGGSLSSYSSSSSSSSYSYPPLKPTPTQSTELTLDNLIELQLSEGNWELSSRLATMISKSEALLETAIPNHIAKHISDGKTKKTMWATAIALALLETNYMTMQEKWTLLSNKAYEWLQNVLNSKKIKDITSDD